MADAKDIMELALKLNLMNIANGNIDLNDERVSNKDYLYSILSQEYDIRHKNRLRDNRKSARLPNRVFDHEHITKSLEWHINKLKRFDYKHSHQNILLVGECSSGKTALATEICSDALSEGSKCYYILYDELIEAIRSKNKYWKKILDSDIVVIDDFFYVQPTDEELLLAYKALLFLSEDRSLILITNRKLSLWKDMDVDKHLINTFQKRLLQEAQIIVLKPTKQ